MIRKIQLVEKLQKICKDFPEMTIKDIAEYLGQEISLIFLTIKEYDIPYNWKLTH